MTIGIKTPSAPESVPAIAVPTYFEILGMMIEMEMDNQSFEKVQNNIFYFTDFLFFKTPQKFLIVPKESIDPETNTKH